MRILLVEDEPDAARMGAARAIADSGIGQETAALSRLMRDPPG